MNLNKKYFFNIAFIVLIGSSILISNVQAQEQGKFQVALKAFNERFFDASEKLFRKFLEDYPESKRIQQAKLYIAKSLFFQEDYKEAEKISTELVNVSTDKDIRAQGLYWLGRINYEGKKYEKALENFTRVRKDYVQAEVVSNALYFRALSYIELDQEDKAKKQLEEIIEKGQGSQLRENSFKILSSLYYGEKNHGKLQELVLAWKKEFSQSSYADYMFFYLAEAKYYYQKYDLALAYYKKALDNLQTADLNDLIKQGLGWTYVEKEEYEKAEETFKEISSEETKMYSLATLYYNMQEHRKSNDVFDEFIANYSKSHLIHKVYLGKAESLYELGRINDSIIFYSKVVDNRQDLEDESLLKEAYRGLGWCYLKLSKYKSAIDYFDKLSEFSDEEIVKLSAQVNIAGVYQDSGQLEKALAIYEEILNKFPDNLYSDYIQLQIGICFLKKNDFEASLLAFNNLRNNFPDSNFKQEAVYYTALSYTYLGNFGEAVNILKDFIKNYKENKYLKKSYLLLIQVYTEQGLYRQVLDVIGQAFRKFSQDEDFASDLKLQKGILFVDRGEFDLAIDTFKDLLSFSQDVYLKSKATFYLASIYHLKGDYLSAKKYYKQILKDFPVVNYTYQSRLNLAEILWEEGEFDEANRLLELNLTQTNSKDVGIQTNLMKIGFNLDQNNYKKAIEVCDYAIEKYPDKKGLFYFKKAKVFEEKRDYRQAYNNYLEAEKEGYKSPELYYFKGYALEKLGDFGEAVKSFFELTYVYPDKQRFVTKAYLHIAKLYEMTGNLKEAQKAYQKVVDIDAEEKKYALQKIAELEKKDNKN